MNVIQWKSVEDYPLGVCHREEVPGAHVMHFTLYPGYEDNRLLAVKLNDGTYEAFIGCIDDDGDLINSNGDNTGLSVDDVAYWAEYTQPGYESKKAYRPGVELIAAERARQIKQERWSLEHDDTHVHNELGDAAAVYAMSHTCRNWMLAHSGFCVAMGIFPFSQGYFKPSWSGGTGPGRIRELQKAGALIAAEIERLLRAQQRKDIEDLKARARGENIER
ncbi:MAG: hypothetical protein Q7Q73_02555 [Verrucomicrobiota bacterium JB024]|nr:hypothetical protein [Verrucomicrobiota bacterium JB024]